LIWDHRDRDLIGVFVHRAGCGIDPKPVRPPNTTFPAAIASVFEAITPEPGK
jgi:hypothetical protein